MNWCENCALRLYNTKNHNLQGIGNPWAGNCIVVSNVDGSAYKHGDMSFSKQVEVIKETIIPSTGVEDSNLFIVPLIRCNENISCKLDTASYAKCLHYFAEDVEKYDFKHIMLLGTAARRFLSTDITPYLNTIVVSSNNREYAVNYSPFIKYVDERKYDVFKNQLLKWYNAIQYDNFKYYEFIKV